MNIKAMSDFLVLSVVEAPTRIGSLEIPEVNRERLRKRPIGRVMSAGPEVFGVSVGDVVLFADIPTPANFVYGIDGEMLLYLRATEVAGIVESDGEADPERRRQIKAENEKLDDERRAKQNLVIASGSLNGNRIR